MLKSGDIKLNDHILMLPYDDTCILWRISCLIILSVWNNSRDYKEIIPQSSLCNHRTTAMVNTFCVCFRHPINSWEINTPDTKKCRFHRKYHITQCHSCFSWLTKYEKSRNCHKSASIHFSVFYKKSAPIMLLFCTLWYALDFMKVNTWWDMRMCWKFWLTMKNNYELTVRDFMNFAKIAIIMIDKLSVWNNSRHDKRNNSPILPL